MTIKGLDSTFVHYGIRKEDLAILESLAEKHGLDYEWIQESILRIYHEQKTKDDNIDDRALVRLVEKALSGMVVKPCK